VPLLRDGKGSTWEGGMRVPAGEARVSSVSVRRDGASSQVTWIVQPRRGQGRQGNFPCVFQVEILDFGEFACVVMARLYDRPMHKPIVAIFIITSLLLASCSSLYDNALQSSEQRVQANDTLTGTAHLGTTLVTSTTLSAFRQPFTTARLGITALWHRPREVAVAITPRALSPATPSPAASPGTDAFETLLDRGKISKPAPGRIEWLVDGKNFFPALDREIASATKSIDLQVFIFDNDDIAVRYADKLMERAADIKVRVMFDKLGSAFAHMSAPETPAPRGFTPPADITAYFRQSGDIRVRRSLNPWLVCDHTKLITFDGKAAFLGGMNIGREYYSEWHDLMLRVEGPVVADLQRGFNRAWRKAGPAGDFSLLRNPAAIRRPAPGPDDIAIRILRTDPARGRYEILKSTMMAIRAAERRIWVQNPYIAHEDIVVAMEHAAARGVDFRLIIPGEGDSMIMQGANLAVARRIILAGGRVYSYPRMTHMKVMVCDDWATAGSANVDTLSMRINRELNIAIRDPATIADLNRRVFTPDFQASRRLTLADVESTLAPIAKLIADQL